MERYIGKYRIKFTFQQYKKRKDKGENMDLNKMRELKNVVVRLANDPSLLELCMKVSRENLDMKVHNAGMSAIRGNYGDRDILEAKASVYVSDLVHAIQCFVENGNDSTFTIGNSMYPNAEDFDWDCQ